MFGGKLFKRKDGKEITLLTPAGKGKKYSKELKDGHSYTNSGKLRTDEDGPIPLSNEQKAWRSGYLQARKDGAAAYKYNKNKKQTTRSRKK